MRLTVSEYAAQRGISPQRVRELAEGGKLAAHKQAGRWVITESPAAAEPGTRRRLSEKSQYDLITFLNTLSFDHVHGNERSRLAERLRELETSPQKAKLLREYFREAKIPDNARGGGAIILAALEHRDEQVQNVVQIRPMVTLDSPAAVAKKLRNMRVLSGKTQAQVAAEAELSIDTVRQLERYGRAPRANLDAVRAFKAVGYTPATVNADPSEIARGA